jgi:3-deoxy-D-manno-octulosonate 8-phosphate phosphatase (KDO 8-P phosphatase)
MPTPRRPEPDYAALKALVLDVDGVLTDGGLYVGDDGATFKRFSILDGAGLVYWRRAGLPFFIVSGHASEATRARFTALGAEEVHVGVKDKLEVFEDVLSRRGLKASEVAAVGDDYMDLPILRRAGFAATPPHAAELCRDAAHLVTRAEGGRGCVREVVEHLLTRRGALEGVLAPYLR